ncbi:MAG: sulfotransferase [Candidatus Sulfotelmatobacter sp.]
MKTNPRDRVMLEHGPGVSAILGNNYGAHRKLPSFFVVGPPRTGTSWLQTVLSQCAWLSHPTKETRFFDKNFDRGLGWYISHYKRVVGERAVGEIAPTYFASPSARDRIAHLIPTARIVCTFRNPVDRVFSLYRLKRAYGWIQWTFEDALARDPELMESSRYADHLKGWLHAFGSSQVMPTVHDDMQADPQGYLDKLVDFVGAKRIKLHTGQVHRVLASDSMTQPRNYYWTRGALWLAEWSKRRRLDGVITTAKKMGATRFFVGGGEAFPELSMPQRHKLRELFRPEVEKLESMLNRDLSAWK